MERFYILEEDWLWTKALSNYIVQDISVIPMLQTVISNYLAQLKFHGLYREAALIDNELA